MSEEVKRACVAAMIILVLIAAMILSVPGYAVENYSDDYENAVQYLVTADYLDIASMNSYPQKVEKVYSEKPYSVLVSVKNRFYFGIEPVPYEQYSYDYDIERYLKASQGIPTETEYVSKTADSFVSKGASVQIIVGNALRWIRNNMVNDDEQADMIWTLNYIPKTAEECIKFGRGSDVQFAYVFIALMRHLGIPARFVSGYCQDPDPAYRAWAEFYLEGYGWIPVDTKACKLGVPDSYIKLFAGMDLSEINVRQSVINARYIKIEQKE